MVVTLGIEYVRVTISQNQTHLLTDANITMMK